MMQEMQYKFAMIMPEISLECAEISLMGCDLCKNAAPSAHFLNNWALNPQLRKVHFLNYNCTKSFSVWAWTILDQFSLHWEN